MLSNALLGMAVHTSEGNEIGTVSEIQGSFFKVEAPTLSYYWLKEECVESTFWGVRLSFPFDQLGRHMLDEPSAT